VASKDLFIHHIQQVEVGDSKNIPTTVFYETDTSYRIGYDALEATDDVLAVNQDFKIDLGRHDSHSPTHNLRFRTAVGSEKSAYAITQDFITKVLTKVSFWLDTHQVEEAAHILIAEPLAMHAENDSRWLENYRRNLRDMLSGKQSSDFPNIRFDEVSFLPEPFAVFQYYRYGINHPLMTQAIKQQALIVDLEEAHLMSVLSKPQKKAISVSLDETRSRTARPPFKSEVFSSIEGSPNTYTEPT
jgi:hypothetical protein